MLRFCIDALGRCFPTQLLIELQLVVVPRPLSIALGGRRARVRCCDGLRLVMMSDEPIDHLGAGQRTLALGSAADGTVRGCEREADQNENIENDRKIALYDNMTE